MENVYIQYYSVQTGSGLKDIGPLYHNLRFVQQGAGFGSFFGTLYRFLKPMIHSGLNVLQNQALKTGSAVLSELGSRPLNEILIEHGKKAGEDLKTKFKNKFQRGSGLMFAAKRKPTKKSIKAKNAKKRNQSAAKRKKNKTSKKKSVKSRILDIFSK